MREILSTENSELVCNELHVETIPKKDLQWTSWQLDTSQKLRADEQCDGVYNSFFAPNRRGLYQQEGQKMQLQQT